jgi:hypothetical protein
MKSIILLALLAIATPTSAQTAFSSSGSVSQTATNIGAKTIVQMKSVNGSSARMNVQRNFSYSNGVTTNSFSFTFSGSTPYKVTNQFNSSTSTFSNVIPSFKFD